MDKALNYGPLSYQTHSNNGIVQNSDPHWNLYNENSLIKLLQNKNLSICKIFYEFSVYIKVLSLSNLKAN